MHKSTLDMFAMKVSQHWSVDLHCSLACAVVNGHEGGYIDSIDSQTALAIEARENV